MGGGAVERGPGSTCRLRAVWWEGPLPVEGDLLRTDAGSCYRIDAVVPGTGRTRATFRCTRLERDSVEWGPGVFRWAWASRK